MLHTIHCSCPCPETVFHSQILHVSCIENIFKVASSSLRSRQQENLRPRAYTQSSNPTGRSTTSDEAALYDASYIRPVRQPFNPPEISLIQKHAGFARFLKQHASPPHHRVTAGGRIVPAGPQSPPPMMLLPSINAVIANPSSKALNNQQINQADTSIKTSSTFKAPVPPTMGPLAPQNTNVGVHKVFEPTQQASHANNPVGNATTGQIQAPLTNLFGTDLGPLPAGATPIGFLPDGSPLVYFNGVNYQSFWDGHSTTLKPLQLPTSAPLSMNYSAGPHTQMAAGSQYQPVYNVGNLSHSQGFNSQFRGTSGFSYAHERNQQSSVPDVEDVQSLHQQLASELTMLDKHVALHLHEFSSSENQRYTARRRQLVEHLDYLRVNKENKGPLNLASDSGYGAQDDAPWPVVNHLAGAPSIPYPSAVRVNGHSYLPTTPIGTQSDSSQLHSFGYNHRLGPPETPVNKSLSPDAPPFVPGTYMARMPPNRSSVSSHQADIGPSKWEAGRTHGLASPYNRVGQGDASKMATATRGIISDENKGATASMSRNLNTSLESQSTEILPTVNLKEIEYTKEHGFNPLHGEKRYCTTVEEFQEVLRRVREQAQMYGCSGGQSKDPAYDAEQDVRWAMADNEPIPLPMGPPDHVAYPRPWNWADSAYNNSNRSLKIGPEWPLGTARQNNFDRILEGWDSKPRPLGDEWRMGPKPGGVKDHKGGPEVFRKKDFGKREISSGWPLQKQPPVQGDCDTGFPSNLRSTPSKGAQPQPSGAAHHLANHQSYMESVPETLAKAKGYYGNSAPNNRINGQAPEVGPLVPFKDSNSGWGPTKRQSDWDKHSALLEETWAREKRTISTVQPDTNSRFTGPWSESLSSGGVESDTPSFLVDSFSGSHDHKNA